MIVIMTPDFGKLVALILSIITHLCSVAIFLGRGFVLRQASVRAGLQSGLCSLWDAKHLLMAWWQADGGVGRWGNEKEESSTYAFTWAFLGAVRESHKFLFFPIHSLTCIECLVYKTSKESYDCIIAQHQNLWLLPAARIWAFGALCDHLWLMPKLPFQLAFPHSSIRFSLLLGEILHLPAPCFFSASCSF